MKSMDELMLCPSKACAGEPMVSKLKVNGNDVTSTMYGKDLMFYGECPLCGSLALVPVKNIVEAAQEAEEEV